ncbi:GNAT family N-acetyltransferase [Aquibium microcysteis]|uniref:GNAT family N-acetyltransferase n=1 Tax=Aquibium microcysteis TaxID=675281 RepID=UPI00165D0E98|nr:GNAT family N-acetyltransferase [Aquibium microcysteis]
MTATVTIRRAEPRDRDELCRQVRALATHHGYDPGSITPQNVAAHFLAPGLPMVVLVASSPDGAVAGYAAASPTHESGYASQGFYLSDLHVDAGRRRAGLGRALLAAMAAETRRAGRQHLWWGVDGANERAEKWYRTIANVRVPSTVFALTLAPFEALADEGERHLGPQG